MPFRRSIQAARWDTFKEAAAGAAALSEAGRDPNSNEVIKAAVADFKRSNDGSIFAIRERFARAEPAERVQRSLASLQEASALVDAKTPDEAAAFKTWLRKINQQVVEASVNGSFLVLVVSGQATPRGPHFATSLRHLASKTLGTAT